MMTTKIKDLNPIPHGGGGGGEIPPPYPVFQNVLKNPQKGGPKIFYISTQESNFSSNFERPPNPEFSSYEKKFFWI